MNVRAIQQNVWQRQVNVIWGEESNDEGLSPKCQNAVIYQYVVWRWKTYRCILRHSSHICMYFQKYCITYWINLMHLNLFSQWIPKHNLFGDLTAVRTSHGSHSTYTYTLHPCLRNMLDCGPFVASAAVALDFLPPLTYWICSNPPPKYTRENI